MVKKHTKEKKRWTSGSTRSCSNCKGTDHNIRTCPKLKKKAKAK